MARKPQRLMFATAGGASSRFSSIVEEVAGERAHCPRRCVVVWKMNQRDIRIVRRAHQACVALERACAVYHLSCLMCFRKYK
jgi:hypothetical protein